MAIDAFDLTKEHRDSLSDADFAVPGKRALPMHDATHTRLAWDMVDRTGGLSDAERHEARAKIRRRAHELGIDTTSWKASVDASFDTLSGRITETDTTLPENAVFALRAMSLDVPDTPGHPNKHPFKGVLTRVDQPSDGPPGGSGGRLVWVTSACARKALPTLIGMAVDMAEDMAGHAEHRKIGLITAANIEGDAVVIEGFFYARDFPDEMRRIRARKKELGFSFELTPTKAAITAEGFYRVDAGYFTGAALLLKKDAAYQTTSLAAATEHQPSDEENTVDKEQIEALQKTVADLTAKVEELTAKAADPLSASATTRALVEPHAVVIDNAADALDLAGIGGHPKRGHAVMLRGCAADMRASAAVGRIPHVYNDHNWSDMSASTETEPKETAMTEAEKAEVAALKASVDEIKASLQGLTASLRASSVAPERKTLAPAVTTLLSRYGLTANVDAEGRTDRKALEEGMKSAGMSIEQRIALKRGIERAEQGLAP